MVSYALIYLMYQRGFHMVKRAARGQRMEAESRTARGNASYGAYRGVGIFFLAGSGGGGSEAALAE